MRKKKTEAVKEVERERDRHDQEGSPDQQLHPVQGQ